MSMSLDHSFLLLPDIPFCEYSTFLKIFHSTLDGHLDGFQFRAVANGAAMNVLVHVFWLIYGTAGP